MQNEYSVIKKIMRTEKGTGLTETNNQYLFEVGVNSNKIQIRQAIEKIYKVKVLSIQTSVIARKPKTLRREAGLTSKSKKAYVTLVK
ncbi:MAG: 50S ribosomal protein L23, partial [Candidatus Omnitrophica bacterium]|nr:50S ribosomal protein L23 [Candidatus Omnitrophota bacterium]